MFACYIPEALMSVTVLARRSFNYSSSRIDCNRGKCIPVIITAGTVKDCGRRSGEDGRLGKQQ
eukprot:2222817-Amphidinium_carterae.1